MPATDSPAATAHLTFVVGRYRNGALSDGWTDVTRCGWGTFTEYLPTCGCGWRGTPQVPDDQGADRCHQQLAEHLSP